MKENQLRMTGPRLTAAVLAEFSHISEDVVYTVCHPKHF